MPNFLDQELSSVCHYDCVKAPQLVCIVEMAFTLGVWCKMLSKQIIVHLLTSMPKLTGISNFMVELWSIQLSHFRLIKGKLNSLLGNKVKNGNFDL